MGLPLIDVQRAVGGAHNDRDRPDWTALWLPVVRKFFLHVSKKEQKQRFLDRIEDPLKNWKFSSNDANERDYWDDYMKAYEEMIQETATKHAPWYVVPANNKWFTRVVVALAVIEALASLDLAYPEVDQSKLKELAAAKKKLLSK